MRTFFSNSTTTNYSENPTDPHLGSKSERGSSYSNQEKSKPFSFSSEYKDKLKSSVLFKEFLEFVF
ncbi:hypothetical protein DQM68_04885 [Leptospira mayottensis]|uniref:Uncharacterized protein n=2 Tax=Leptospira mayottensis TaxID=1137606 RepID=A0AA87MQ56_9LEPT|nr:hypothetical protein DQM68_04885 [Leptospira mayottensis]AZQ03439.1 hypothetical protein LEP1GSC190_16865 [Leptospira mayottensis 200901116]EKR99806.1 hypothetical protein LEP1GSC125_0162 [Leptospira mayottensis 200901122]AXR63611.1 hypothetical protein DQM28_04600 [Leptospira mayottensis]AXR67694.1 hypothetical protein DPV73_06390 [Leptospira mayottensis]